MNTKTVLLVIAVIGIAAVLVVGASAYKSNGEDFGGKGGKGFAKMNSAVRDCLKDARDECRAGIDFNATGARKEMWNCTRAAFKDCRKDLNLTCNLSGMRAGMKNCLNDTISECRASIDFNAPGAGKEMWNCTRAAFKDCRQDLNLTCNLSGMRAGMKNCLNDTISECRASIDFNATGAGKEMWNCTKEAFKDCRQGLNLTGNAGCSFLAMKKMQNNIRLNLKEKIKRNAIKNRWFGQ